MLGFRCGAVGGSVSVTQQRHLRDQLRSLQRSPLLESSATPTTTAPAGTIMFPSEAFCWNQPTALHQSHLFDSTTTFQQSHLCESTAFPNKVDKRTRGLESRSDSPWLGQGPQRRDPASERYNRLTRTAWVSQQSHLSQIKRVLTAKPTPSGVTPCERYNRLTRTAWVTHQSRLLDSSTLTQQSHLPQIKRHPHIKAAYRKNCVLPAELLEGVVVV